jgi:hypothetical protein
MACKGCTLCCTLLAVLELDKPADVPCKHITDTGCAIYEDRPQSCRDVECLWLLTRNRPREFTVAMPAATRPDRTGVVVTAHEGYVVFHVDPARPDADNSGAMQPVASKLLKRGVRVLSRCGEARHEIRLRG